MFLASGVQLWGRGIFKVIDNLCRSIVCGGLGVGGRVGIAAAHPLTLAYGRWSQSDVFILGLACDVFSAGVP